MCVCILLRNNVFFLNVCFAVCLFVCINHLYVLCSEDRVIVLCLNIDCSAQETRPTVPADLTLSCF